MEPFNGLCTFGNLGTISFCYCLRKTHHMYLCILRSPKCVCRAPEIPCLGQDAADCVHLCVNVQHPLAFSRQENMELLAEHCVHGNAVWYIRAGFLLQRREK